MISTNPIAHNIFHEIVKKINNNTLQLASLPDLIIKVNTVLADERKGLMDIANVIQHEISLSTRIIHIANSPAIRGSRPVVSVSDALNRLGIDLVKNLAVCVLLKDKFNTKNLVHKHLMVDALETSTLRSVYGFLISKYLVPDLIPEVSLISGLVSKIGHVVILRYINDTAEYKLLHDSTVLAIMEEYGDEISEVILRRWDFPTAIIDSTFGHTVPNTVAPETYHDVYVLTTKYIQYKAGEGEINEKFAAIDEVIAAHPEEYNSLAMLLE